MSNDSPIKAREVPERGTRSRVTLGLCGLLKRREEKAARKAKALAAKLKNRIEEAMPFPGND